MNKSEQNIGAFQKYLEKSIFATKWLLIPFYLGLVAVLIKYMLFFIGDVYHFMLSDIHGANEFMLLVVEFIDIVMIGNLVKFMITGSYNSFVNKSRYEDSEKVSSGTLKVKMGTAIIGISSIHLLQTFMAVDHLSWDTVYKQLLIHLAFIVGGWALAHIDLLHSKTDSH